MFSALGFGSPTTGLRTHITFGNNWDLFPPPPPTPEDGGGKERKIKYMTLYIFLLHQMLNHCESDNTTLDMINQVTKVRV